ARINNIWYTELLRGVAVTSACAAILLVALLLYGVPSGARKYPTKARLVLFGLPIALFLDLWQIGGTYTPSIEPQYYYPVTPEISYLQHNQGLSRFAAQGFNLPPNTNLVYGLSDLRGYDNIMPLTFME